VHGYLHCVHPKNLCQLGNSHTNSLEDDFLNDPPKIIGTKKFAMDDQLMNHHVVDVLQWWLGHRRPRGVRVEHSSRCL
jgi:hypothetical protein